MIDISDESKSICVKFYNPDEFYCCRGCPIRIECKSRMSVHKYSLTKEDLDKWTNKLNKAASKAIEDAGGIDNINDKNNTQRSLSRQAFTFVR